jgi:uncharacterized membrane protein
MTTQIDNLERRVALLDAELSAVRHELRALKGPRITLPVAAPVLVKRKRELPSVDLEDLLAGRVMAWVGGSAVLVGMVLFLAMAVSRGWIGEEARTAMAGLVSLLLVAGGARAYERRGRTEAALAATGAGIAGGFGTLAVATEVYGLLPAAVGLSIGLALGAVAVWLALRWESRTVAVLGIAGGLLSPVLCGADLDSAKTMGLLATGYAGAVAVCVVLGWARLGLLAFALAMPQWVYHAIDGGSLVFVTLFGVLGAAAAVGFAWRTRAEDLRLESHLLLGLNALFTTIAGVAVLDHPEPWLVAMAAAHLIGGFLVPPALRTATLGLGIVLADIAFADLVDGLALPLAWAAGAVGFALLHRAREIGRTAAALGLGGHLAIAIGHVITQEAPFGDLGGDGSAAGLMAVTAIAATCLLSGRLVGTRLGRTLDVTGLLAVAYATALAFDGGALAVAWAAEAAALGQLGREDERARSAGCLFLAGALLAALGSVAPLDSLADGVGDLPAAAFALAAITGAAVALRSPLGAATLALYLASIAVVTLIDGQPGQLALSALWCVTGLAALAFGVVRDQAAVRTCALALLAAVTGKVFVVDLAALDSMARVGSFLVLGTLLLAGAFAWQRARPGSIPAAHS